jgi:hypothetical protein
MKLTAFYEQIALAEKSILIFFSTFTILGNTLVLVATWQGCRKLLRARGAIG